MRTSRQPNPVAAAESLVHDVVLAALGLAHAAALFVVPARLGSSWSRDRFSWRWQWCGCGRKDSWDGGRVWLQRRCSCGRLPRVVGRRLTARVEDERQRVFEWLGQPQLVVVVVARVRHGRIILVHSAEQLARERVLVGSSPRGSHCQLNHRITTTLYIVTVRPACGLRASACVWLCGQSLGPRLRSPQTCKSVDPQSTVPACDWMKSCNLLWLVLSHVRLGATFSSKSHSLALAPLLTSKANCDSVRLFTHSSATRVVCCCLLLRASCF